MKKTLRLFLLTLFLSILTQTAHSNIPDEIIYVFSDFSFIVVEGSHSTLSTAEEIQATHSNCWHEYWVGRPPSFNPRYLYILYFPDNSSAPLYLTQSAINLGSKKANWHNLTKYLGFTPPEKLACPSEKRFVQVELEL